MWLAIRLCLAVSMPFLVMFATAGSTVCAEQVNLLFFYFSFSIFSYYHLYLSMYASVRGLLKESA